MITYEPTFICDGAKVLNQKCKAVITGDTFSGSLNIGLPRNWGCAIIRGTRYEFCPSCFGWWFNNNRKAPLTKVEIEDFEQRCNSANWNYDYADNHSDYTSERAECDMLRELANRHSELKPILQRYANKTTATGA